MTIETDAPLDEVISAIISAHRAINEPPETWTSSADSVREVIRIANLSVNDLIKLKHEINSAFSRLEQKGSQTKL